MSRIQVLVVESGESLETVEEPMNRLVELYELRERGGWEGVINLDLEVIRTNTRLNKALREYALRQAREAVAT